MSRPGSASGAALLRELLDDPDRDRIPGARPVVTVRDDDEPAFRGEVAARAAVRIALERRGARHGTWVELDGEPWVASGDGECARWSSARPLVARGVLAGGVAPDELEQALALHGELLRDPERALGEWLREATRGGPFRPLAAGAGRASRGGGRRRRTEGFGDPERDLARAFVTEDGADDTWVKVGRLSTHPADASLRLRVSFGREIADDASADGVRHRRVARLAERCVPGASAVAACAALRERLERLCGGSFLLTQQIAYWNAPGGGALFHHDAFDEPSETRQRGVCFVQLAGRTAWLALSIDDLAERTAEVLAALADGDLPGVRAAAFPRPDDLPQALALAEDRTALALELALPGCGRLGALVNRGPEVTSYLADSGHACVLHPGDAILLPNGGLGSTAMHSAFCGSDRPTYGVSSAVRLAGG